MWWLWRSVLSPTPVHALWICPKLLHWLHSQILSRMWLSLLHLPSSPRVFFLLLNFSNKTKILHAAMWKDNYIRKNLCYLTFLWQLKMSAEQLSNSGIFNIIFLILTWPKHNTFALKIVLMVFFDFHKEIWLGIHYKSWSNESISFILCVFWRTLYFCHPLE